MTRMYETAAQRAAGALTRAWGQVGAVAVAALLATSTPAVAAPGDTRLVTRDPASGQAFGGMFDYAAPSTQHAVSSWGRFVLVMARGEAGVGGHTSPGWGLILHDRASKTWEKVDLATDGQPAGFTNWSGLISPNARFVAWQTNSHRVVPGMNPGMDWVAVLRDRRTGVTELLSVDRTGTHARRGRPLGVSNDGRHALFSSDATDLADAPVAATGDTQLYLRDRAARTTRWLSGCADAAALSADGRYLAYSDCSRLVLRELASGLEQVVDSGAAGYADAYLSGDGRWLVYSRGAGDYHVQPDPRRLYLYDRTRGARELVGVDANGQPPDRDATDGVVTDDGRYVSFHSFSRGVVVDGYEGGVFLRDRAAGTTRRASVDSHGGGTTCCAFGAVSADGRFVFFEAADPLVRADRNREYDLYVHEVGAEPRTPEFTFAVNPSALDFGDQALGAKTSKKFWIRNTGRSGLPIVGTRIVGTDHASFSRSHGCYYLYPGESCAVRITLNAFAPGPKQAALEVVGGIDARQLRPVTANVMPPQ